MTINELREKRAKLWDGMKAYLETHRQENGTLSAEDDAAYTKMENEISDLGREISRLERQEAMERELSKPVNKPLTGRPGMKEPEEKTGRASNAYREAMLTALRSNFKRVENVLQEGVDADGGYLVPEEYDRRLVLHGKALPYKAVHGRLVEVVVQVVYELDEDYVALLGDISVSPVYSAVRIRSAYARIGAQHIEAHILLPPGSYQVGILLCRACSA